MYFKVYDPKGEMFEVIASVAKTLIVDHGWTTLPPDQATPVFKEPEAPTPVEPAPTVEPEQAPAPTE